MAYRIQFHFKIKKSRELPCMCCKTKPATCTINSLQKKLLTKWEKMGAGGVKWE
jgi:hypothetical protein